MARISGRAGVVYLGAATAIPVTNSAEWAIDIEVGIIDSDPVFEDTWGDSWQSVKRYSVTFSGLYSDSADELYDAIVTAAGTTHRFYVYPASGSTSLYWYGTINVRDFNVTTPAAGNVTVRASGRGTGTLGKHG